MINKSIEREDQINAFFFTDILFSEIMLLQSFYFFNKLLATVLFSKSLLIFFILRKSNIKKLRIQLLQKMPFCFKTKDYSLILNLFNLKSFKG